jgi:hypothetical protein
MFYELCFSLYVLFPEPPSGPLQVAGSAIYGREEHILTLGGFLRFHTAGLGRGLESGGVKCAILRRRDRGGKTDNWQLGPKYLTYSTLMLHKRKVTYVLYFGYTLRREFSFGLYLLLCHQDAAEVSQDTCPQTPHVLVYGTIPFGLGIREYSALACALIKLRL